MSETKFSTLCYIEKDEKYLMLHRTVKKNDVNKDMKQEDGREAGMIG